MTAPTFVGSGKASSTAANYNITLPAMLPGDFVLVGYGFTNAADSVMGVNTAGYTEVPGANLYADDTHDINFAVAGKFMGETPDTVVNVNGSGSAQRGSSGIVHVWRGVDPSIFDVAAVPATGVNSPTPDPAAITPVTPDTMIIAFAAASGIANTPDATGSAPSGYGNLVAESSGGSTDSIAVMAASKAWAGGEENPGTFTGFDIGGGSPATCSWAAVTIALRPLASTSGNHKSLGLLGVG